jgi:hypothetical protein
LGKPSKIYGEEKFVAEPAPSFTPQPEKKAYVFINFLLVAIGGFLAANYFAEQGKVVVYLIAFAGVVICFSIFSGLLENKKWADYAEVIRLVLITIIGVVISFNQQMFQFGIVSIFVSLLLLSFTWFIAARYKKQYHLQTSS